MSSTPAADDLADQFVTLNTYLHAGGSAATAQQRLVDLACALIPRCDWAGLARRPSQAPARTVIYSGEIAYRLDRLQYELGDGPCLEAARRSETVWTGELAAEHRWPHFRAAALDQSPVRGVMSFHLLDEPVPTALNLYTATPNAFDHSAITVGALFAAHARVLMAHADSAHQARTLETALSTNRQIGAAIGILMMVHKVTESEAFELLRTTSNHLNRKLFSVAEDVTETGELPGRDTF